MEEKFIQFILILIGMYITYLYISHIWKMISDAYSHKHYIWVVSILLTNIVGAVIYYYTIYKYRNPYDKKY